MTHKWADWLHYRCRVGGPECFKVMEKIRSGPQLGRLGMSPLMPYLGHVLAHRTQADLAWDMVTTQLHHNIAAYRTLPLNACEKAAIINAVLIPRWTYRGLFLGNSARMAHWDDIVLQHIRNTAKIEQQMNKHRLTTNLSNGRLGLRQWPLWAKFNAEYGY